MQRSHSPIYPRKPHRHHSSGLTLSELVVSTGAGILIIAAAAVALRSTQTLMERSTSKTTVRQNSTNGLRILRSEVERGTNIIIKSDITPAAGLMHTDLTNKNYKKTLDKCEELASDKSQVFQPVFGISMPERDLKYPVIYGFSLNEKGNGYSLKRCGAPLSTSGQYDETKGLFIANAIDDIGIMGCPSNYQGECAPPTNDDGSVKGLTDIARDFDISFSYNICDDGEKCFSSPVPSFKQPALRIETDESRKLIKFIDPDSSSDNEQASYLEIISGTRSITKQPLYLAAFARSNKYIKGNENDGEIDDTIYFRNVTSDKMRFLLDGSGSMSACILWSGASGNSRTYYDPNKRSYVQTREICSLTRMESLQTELINLLTSLPADTEIGIESFSSPNYANHRSWEPSKDGLVRIGNPEVLESAIEFINTLDDASPTRWGSTLPWEGLNDAIDDNGTDTLYFLSDGNPYYNYKNKRWKESDGPETVKHFTEENKNRNKNGNEPLKINTIALGLESKWMEDLAINSNGIYLQIDSNTLATESSNQSN